MSQKLGTILGTIFGIVLNRRPVIHTKRIFFFSFMFHFAMDHLPDRCDDVKENFHLQRALKFGKI